MNDNNEDTQPPDRVAEIEALSEAIRLASLGVLPSRTIKRLIDLRSRLTALQPDYPQTNR